MWPGSGVASSCHGKRGEQKKCALIQINTYSLKEKSFVYGVGLFDHLCIEQRALCFEIVAPPRRKTMVLVGRDIDQSSCSMFEECDEECAIFHPDLSLVGALASHQEISNLIVRMRICEC